MINILTRPNLRSKNSRGIGVIGADVIVCILVVFSVTLSDVTRFAVDIFIVPAVVANCDIVTFFAVKVVGSVFVIADSAVFVVKSAIELFDSRIDFVDPRIAVESVVFDVVISVDKLSVLCVLGDPLTVAVVKILVNVVICLVEFWGISVTNCRLV